jgi:hypothetical protein
VIQAAETEQVHRVTSDAAAHVGGGPTVVVEVELMICQLMQCRLGGTLVEHPQYYLREVLIRPSFSSSLIHPIQLGRYSLV